MAKIDPKPIAKVKEEGYAILLFGDTATGKTKLLTTGKDMVVLNTERKSATLKANAERMEANNVLHQYTPTLDYIVGGMQWCLKNKMHCAIDSITHWQLMSHIEHIGKRNIRNYRDWEKILLDVVRAIKFIPALREAGLDVVVTAHATRKIPRSRKAAHDADLAKNPDDRDEIFAEYSLAMPALLGSMRDEFKHWFDLVGFMEKERKKGGTTYHLKFDCSYADVKSIEGKPPNLRIDGDSPDTLQQILARVT